MPAPLVVGNWKMNGNRQLVSELLGAIVAVAPNFRSTGIGICPPFPYVAEVAARCAGTGLLAGAQDLSEHEAGAYTGEVSGDMLAELGCDLVIVGHSERRQYHGESSDGVARKFAAALQHGLRPILCVGETLEQREAGDTVAVVSAQLGAVLDLCGGQALGRGVVAYEPVWAIGTGRTATAQQAQEIHALLREQLRAANAPADKILLLYGGSVKPANAAELFAQPDIDGGLSGGASLQAEDFLAICEGAEGICKTS